MMMETAPTRPSVPCEPKLWVQRILYNWAQWMFSGGYSEFHVRSLSIGEGFTHYDSDGEYQKADVALAKLTDAVIRDLKAMEREAIEAEYLRRTWMRAVSIHPVLVIAHEAVRMGLQRKGFIWEVSR